MRYVRSIRVNDGVYMSHYSYPTYRSGDNLLVTVHNSETGVDFEYTREELDTSFLGYGIDVFGSRAILVEMSAKEALLHKYITQAHTVMGEVEHTLFGDKVIGRAYDGSEYIDFVKCCQHIHADWIEFRAGKVVGIDLERGHKSIVVNTTTEAVEVCGELGSVASRSGNLVVDPAILTLYKLLGMMVNETGVNLLTYDTVWFYCPMRGRLVELALKHDVEADRFFTKMYLDVVGK